MINFNVNKKDKVNFQNTKNIPSAKKNQPSSSNISKSDDTMNALSLMGKVNMSKITFSGETKKKYAGHEINFTEEELDKKLNDQTTTLKMLSPESVEYKNLEEGDKKALKHLVKAGALLNDVFLDLDHEKNIEFKKSLTEAANSGDTHAQKALKLFNAQNGAVAVDRESKLTCIFKDTEEKPGKNFYPSDITKEELQQTLKKMLLEGKKDQAQAILSQRSIVKRNENGELYAVDYVDAYEHEFHAAADELDKAAKVSTNKDFNNYLTAQATAFRKADPELDCEADKRWAQLQDTPLEFTITREQYDDCLGGTVQEDEELNGLIKQNGIDAQTKDAIGIRVGIVNKEGTKEILEFKKYLPELAEQMPLKEQYTQSISGNQEAKQTMVDADIVSMTGDSGGYRGGITIAENLPNDDKLSVKRDYGRRNVYHRSVRLGGNPEKLQKRLDATLDPSLHKFYSKEADHRFVIGHENAHSLGPKEKSSLGQYNNTIEENKADMGSLASLDFLVQKGKYTEKEKNEILVTWAEGELLKAKPELSQAHRVRSVMQTNYFIEKGALDIDKNGILSVNLEKMVPTAKAMLEDDVRLQLSKDPKKAEEFVNKYFQWTDNLEKCTENIRKTDTALYGRLEQPLAEKLLAE
jgi:hypothetical protein